MRKKTDANIEAAKFLINSEDGKHCNASIHCSYYAVLQYMKFILHNLKTAPISYDMQKEKGGQSSHDYIFGEILIRLTRCNITDLRNYKNSFNCIKKYRTEVDYSTKTFQLEDCLTCQENAERLIVFLRSQFNKQIAS